MPGSLRAWAVALRPRSLGLVGGPVLVGCASALGRERAIDAGAALLALAAAVLMQLITNLQNDVGYTQRGAEAVPGRVGLPRATARGWLSVMAVRRAVLALCTLAAGLGLLLVWQRGLPVLGIGAASLLAALAYMGGPRPIAYTPLGELTVLVFFGGVAVAGTDWLVSGRVGLASWPASAAMGALAAAALVVNNHRDREHDRAVGRSTFAVRFGDRASLGLFKLALFGPFALLPLVAWFAGQAGPLAPALLLPRVMALHRDFLACGSGAAWNGLLMRTFALSPAFALLLALGLVLPAVV